LKEARSDLLPVLLPPEELVHLPLLRLAFWKRGSPMSLPRKPGPGVYRKYRVQRLGDKPDRWGRKKHAECEYYVLDLHHDPFAAPALEAYAAACEKTHVELSADLRIKASDVRRRFPPDDPKWGNPAAPAPRKAGKP
jgi:hypothetical protein